jgi:hypothetical protein
MESLGSFGEIWEVKRNQPLETIGSVTKLREGTIQNCHQQETERDNGFILWLF